MNVSDLDSPRSKPHRSRTWLRGRPGSLLKMDRFESRRRLGTVSRDEPKLAAAVSPAASFTPEEIRSFGKDDAMAGGMIGVILGLAFLFLLTAAVAVSIWTLVVVVKS